MPDEAVPRRYPPKNWRKTTYEDAEKQTRENMGDTAPITVTPGEQSTEPSDGRRVPPRGPVKLTHADMYKQVRVHMGDTVPITVTPDEQSAEADDAD